MMASRFVRCDEHGERPGYVVCLCVVDDGARPQIVEPPRLPDDLDDAGEPGAILCSRVGHPLNRLVLVCQDCARARGWVPAPSKRATCLS